MQNFSKLPEGTAWSVKQFSLDTHLRERRRWNWGPGLDYSYRAGPLPM